MKVKNLPQEVIDNIEPKYWVILANLSTYSFLYSDAYSDSYKGAYSGQYASFLKTINGLNKHRFGRLIKEMRDLDYINITKKGYRTSIKLSSKLLKIYKDADMLNKKASDPFTSPYDVVSPYDTPHDDGNNENDLF